MSMYLSAISIHVHYLHILYFKECVDGSYGRSCDQKCTCVEQHQSKACDRMSGECHCLSEYTGQNCELRQDTTTMPDRMMSSRTALIVGTVVGSVLGTSIIVTGIVLVLVLFFIFKKHKNKMENIEDKLLTTIFK